MSVANFMDLSVFLLALLIISTPVFFLCEIGEKMTSQYEFLNYELCLCDWYLFSVGMQKMFATFMSYTQHPVFIHGYGNTLTQCTRETLKKVIEMTVLYFYEDRN